MSSNENRTYIKPVPINWNELTGKKYYGKTEFGDAQNGTSTIPLSDIPTNGLEGTLKKIGDKMYFCATVGGVCILLGVIASMNIGGRTKYRRKSNRKHSKTKRK